MNKATRTTLPAEWTQYLQRRIMRLLLQYDRTLFRKQFRLFYRQSSLPTLPVLQRYDQYLKILVQRDPLFHILERIDRQLRAQNSQVFRQEEAPTRGEIDWLRTSARTLNETPGLPPLLFETNQRSRSMLVPENIFVVAILLKYRQAVRDLVKQNLTDETLSSQESQQLSELEERLTKRLATPYAYESLEVASEADLEQLTAQVRRQLPPGNGPYRDLLECWEQFNTLRIGQESDDWRNQLALSSKSSHQQHNAWLYELWAVLELIHLLEHLHLLTPDDLSVASDQIRVHFAWNGRTFLFTYTRRQEKNATDAPGWQNIAAVPPCYTLKLAEAEQGDTQNTPAWSESRVIGEIGYEASTTSPVGALKKLLGEMRISGASHGFLLSPLLADPPEGTMLAYTRRNATVYSAGMSYNLARPAVCLCKLLPNRDLALLHERLKALLDDLTSQAILPDHSQPDCHGILLDQDTVHASGSPMPAYNVLCPKPHLGAGVFDLVNDQIHCLKDPLLCHIYGQAKLAPFVVRATTKEEMGQQSGNIRTQADTMLSEAEKNDDTAKAEELREQIFQGVGQTVERFVKSRGKAATAPIEKYFEDWAFATYWKKDPRCLTEETRNILLSGEYVWQEYQNTDLQDWAAPAIQYCRALEIEVKRRLAAHYPAPYPRGFDLSKAGHRLTLGALTKIYAKRDQWADAKHNWGLLTRIVQASHSNLDEFMQILTRMDREKVVDYRNLVAHSNPVSQAIAEELRTSIIGSRSKQGILCWMAENLEPKT